MLDQKTLAGRLVEAMDRANPPVKSARLAQACNVTPQAVNGWRTTGKIAKEHLPVIARETGRPLAWFLIGMAHSAREDIRPYDALERNLRIIASEWDALMPEEQDAVRADVAHKAKHNRLVAKKLVGTALPDAEPTPGEARGRKILDIFKPRRK